MADGLSSVRFLRLPEAARRHSRRRPEDPVEMFRVLKSAKHGNFLDPEVGLFQKQFGMADSFLRQHLEKGFSAGNFDQVADPRDRKGQMESKVPRGDRTVEILLHIRGDLLFQ